MSRTIFNNFDLIIWPQVGNLFARLLWQALAASTVINYTGIIQESQH